MFVADGVEYEFHHLGIPTEQELENARFSEKLGMFTRDCETSLARIQWHHFKDDSPLHALIRTVPHLAYKVSNLDRAIAGRTLLLGPFEPIQGYRVAMIEDGNMPVELIETSLTDDEVWSRARTGTDTSIY